MLPTLSSMSRHHFPVSAAAAFMLCAPPVALGLAPGGARSAAAPRPNVVFVMADEWRAQALGYAGDPNVRTPVIDRFAARSLNFKQAISGAPVCCPARASLLTGQYPLSNGVYLNDVPLNPQGVTLGEAFNRAGYNTGYIGKWHLYGSPEGRYERRGAYIPEDKRFGFKYWKAAECTHAYNNSFYYADNDPVIKYWPGYDAFAQTTDACQFIKEKAKDPNPFFLVLSWGPPHFPLDTAPEKYREMYRNQQMQFRPNVPADERAKASADLRGYYAHIAALDESFQQLLDALEEAGVAEDTVVVFTSDHGDMMYSQGLEHKLLPWEEAVRVPLLIRYPRKFGDDGRTSDAMVNTPDIMPTLLGLCGIPIPDHVQGKDYSETALKVADNAPASAFISMPVPITSTLSSGIAEYRGVRTKRYTYVRSNRGPWLLYDNHEDPYQMNNLCGQSAVQEVQRQLEGELAGWMKILDDKFLPAAEYLKRDGWAHFMEAQVPVHHIKSPWGDWESTLAEPAHKLSSRSAVGDLLKNPAARAIFQQTLPGVAANPMFSGPAGWFSLRNLQAFMSFQITDAQLDVLDERLAQLALLPDQSQGVPESTKLSPH